MFTKDEEPPKMIGGIRDLEGPPLPKNVLQYDKDIASPGIRKFKRQEGRVHLDKGMLFRSQDQSKANSNFGDDVMSNGSAHSEDVEIY